MLHPDILRKQKPQTWHHVFLATYGRAEADDAQRLKLKYMKIYYYIMLYHIILYYIYVYIYIYIYISYCSTIWLFTKA